MYHDGISKKKKSKQKHNDEGWTWNYLTDFFIYINIDLNPDPDCHVTLINGTIELCWFYKTNRDYSNN